MKVHYRLKALVLATGLILCGGFGAQQARGNSNLLTPQYPPNYPVGPYDFQLSADFTPDINQNFYYHEMHWRFTGGSWTTTNNGGKWYVDPNTHLYNNFGPGRSTEWRDVCWYYEQTGPPPQTIHYINSNICGPYIS